MRKFISNLMNLSAFLVAIRIDRYDRIEIHENFHNRLKRLLTNLYIYIYARMKWTSLLSRFIWLAWFVGYYLSPRVYSVRTRRITTVVPPSFKKKKMKWTFGTISLVLRWCEHVGDIISLFKWFVINSWLQDNLKLI